MERLFLIGYRGAGKTAVAQLVAQGLGWSWCDADALLEEHAGKTIREIFAEEGEAGFRARETTLLTELAQRPKTVVATGGGVILREDNRRQLKKGGVVWLKASPAVLWQRLQHDSTTAQRRPALAQGGLAEIEELLRVRMPWYEGCAQFTVETEGRALAEVAEEIVLWVQAQPECFQKP